MDSHHNHCHHEHNSATKPFHIAILVNLAFVAIEFYWGIAHHSLALVSDAGHNLVDVFSLFFGWFAVWLVNRVPIHLTAKRKKYTQISYLIALLNLLSLIVGSVVVIYEAYNRWRNPQEPVAMTMIVVAGIGCVINYFSGKLFHQHHHEPNMEAAYLHLMADAAISLGVVVSGILIYFLKYNWVDSLVSGVISVVIICMSGKLVKEYLNKLQSN
jgi:cobalt-zinc-cadmium efflux system protein